MRLVALVLSLCFGIPTSVAQSDYALRVVGDGLNFPWSIAFLPDGDYLVAMRSGDVRRLSGDGRVSNSLKGFPASYVMSQGGYFDIALDPNFASNRKVYLSYAYGTPKENGTRIISGTLNGDLVENVTPIFTVAPLKDTSVHYGGKIQFLADGTLMMTTGDGFEYREAAQDPFNLMGKIIRINSDGGIPADNPFADGKQGHPAVWSYGHRNPQGLVLDADTGKIYSHEHGAQGGDELNLIQPGANYGWPAITKGINYSGAYVSPLRSAPGIVEPLRYWVPSIGPSGMALYKGDAFPEWRNAFFVGALVDAEVIMLNIHSDGSVTEQRMFSEIGARIRDVREGPDGMLYLLTDSDEGKVIRVEPASFSDAVSNDPVASAGKQ